jgi:predicted PurR-regulated permease PerM
LDGYLPSVGIGDQPRGRNSANTFILLVIVTAILFVAREVFIPLALAMLLTFLLAPFLGLLVRYRVPRVIGVIIVVVTAFAAIGGMGYLVTTQVYDLAKKLPDYQDTVKHKLHSLRPPGGGLIERASHFFKETSRELEARNNEAQAANGASDEQKPIPVEVHAPKQDTVQMLKSFVGPALHPLGVAGIVIIFVIFMLLEQDTLRDRFIRLAGTTQLHTTTQALDDAGRRVSRYLLMQLVVNATYGLPIGIGLALIGVPNPLLWGLMATVLRFIPYIGPWIASAFPILLAFAVDPGWSMLFWTIALYLVVELISNNAVEPWLYGSSTGLSSLAIIVSAVFWTWLWGPVGLLLSTPLTVCMVVIGRYFPHLEFLSVILGDEPVLREDARFYQRLLAKDQEEAENLAEDYTKEHSLADTFDNVIVPALGLAEQDKQHGAIPEDEQTFIIEATSEIIHDLMETLQEAGMESSAEPTNGEPKLAKVLCIPAKDEADELAGQMLAILLNKKGVETKALSAKTLLTEYLEEVEKNNTNIICVSCVPPSGLRHARYVCKRLRTRFPELKIIVGIWNSPEEIQSVKDRLLPVAVETIVVTLQQAAEQISALLTVTESSLPAPVPEHEEERLQALKRLDLLSTPKEEIFDGITRELARTFNVPISLVSLIDETRQLWKSEVGLPPDLAAAGEGPRESSICGHVVAANKALIVPDLLKDKRFATNPFVKERGIRFYAGVPLRTHAGHAIGSLCIIDSKPRQITGGEQAYLQMMADRLMTEVESRAEAEAHAQPAQHA